MTESADNASAPLLRALSRRTRQSLEQLQDLRQQPLPVKRQQQLDRLTENAQTYLVFLEETARTGKQDEPERVDAMLATINQHCSLISTAHHQAFSGSGESA